MTLAHLHLVLNHMPILGTLFGLILLFLGLSRGNKILQKAGLVTFVVVALVTIPVFLTGEPAEHLVEDFPGFSHDMAHEHEELGEKGLIIALILGAISAFLVFLLNRNKNLNYKKGMWAVLALSVVSFLFMMLIGNHGGKIRRPELRGEKSEIGNNHSDKDISDED
jgi:uncharacterized membrane protein